MRDVVNERPIGKASFSITAMINHGRLKLISTVNFYN